MIASQCQGPSKVHTQATSFLQTILILDPLENLLPSRCCRACPTVNANRVVSCLLMYVAKAAGIKTANEGTYWLSAACLPLAWAVMTVIL